ncbi:MAG TPA: hypothetical protein VJQ53_05105 [Candidatus Eisenbacteria bacterium]|nr:hypothetical protein [Candidatus Eisenbacteria bacterium]
MKNLRWIVPALLLAAATPGCILVSGQFLIDFDLSNFTTSTDSAVTREDVDLTTESDYQDHKNDLKGLSDVAVLGKVTNNGASSIGVEVWMTPGPTTYTTPGQVTTNGTKLWGPFNLAAGASKQVTWDESANLFSSAGKALLINEIKGDGQFTIYAIAGAGTYSFTVDNGVLALVIDFGK